MTRPTVISSSATGNCWGKPDLSSLRGRLARLLPEYEHTSRLVKGERKALREAGEHLAAVREARALVRSVAKVTMEAAHRSIASVVTRCLEAVFGPGSFRFHIDFVEKRGRTEAELWFLDADGHRTDPLGADSGGAVDVAAFGLRLACLLLSRPKLRRLLVLDEPFRNIHGRGNRERAANLLPSLARDFGLQVILVTGMDWLKEGRVIDLGVCDGED